MQLKWGHPVNGVRYDCVSCRKLQRQHALCASCYSAYPYKAKEPESLTAEDVKEEDIDAHSTSMETGQVDMKEATVLHVFRCISVPGADPFNRFKLFDKRSIDFEFKSGPIGEILKTTSDFSQISCALQCTLLYPLGLLNYLLHRLFTKQIAGDCNSGVVAKGPLRWYLNRTQKSARSFGKLPWIGIGVCLLLNGAAIVGIIGDQYSSGISPTVYWITSTSCSSYNR